MAKRKTKQERERDKRRRRAASAVKKLLARLRKGCDQFETVENWVSFVHERVLPIAETFEDVLPQDTLKTMRKADELAEKTLTAVGSACRVLTGSLEKALISLSAGLVGAGLLGGISAGTLAAGGVIIIAAGVGVAAWMGFAGRTRLTLVSQGCPTIAFPQDLGLLEQLPGLELPQSLPADGEALIAFPAAFNAQVQASPERLTLSARGLAFDFVLSSEVETLSLDGQPLFNAGPVTLTGGEHQLVLSCP